MTLSVPEGMGKPIPGPRAFSGDPSRAFALAWTLAVTDFRLRFFGSFFGYLWTLMRPLLLFGVLYMVFSVLLDLESSAKYQPVAMLLGIVLFQFIGEATQLGVRSFLQREALIRKLDFPLVVVPLASVLTASFSLLLNFVPVTVFLVVSGGRPHWSWLWVPPLLAVLAVFVFGLVCALSALFVRYRDVEPMWDVVMQVLFYATPIIYPLETVLSDDRVPTALTDVLMSSPLAALLQQTRHIFIDSSHPATVDALSSSWMVLIPIAIMIAAVVGGIAIFRRMAPTVSEQL